MGHRHLPNTNPMPEVDNGEVRNHSHPSRSLHIGSSSSGFPLQNIAVSGLNSIPYFNSTIGSNEYPPCPRSNIRPHTNIAEYSQNSCLRPTAEYPIPSNYSCHGFPSYNHKTNYWDEYGSLDPLEESGRCHSRARKPALGIDYNTSNMNGHYSGKPPADVPSSSEHFQQMPVTHSQVHPWDPMNSNYKGKRLLAIEEGSHRNVRPRYPNAIQFDHNQGGTHSSGNSSNHFHLIRGDPSPSILGQWNHNAISLPGDKGPLYSDAGFTKTDGRSYHSRMVSENLNAAPPIAPSDRRFEVNNNYGQSPHQPNVVGTSHPPTRIASTSFHDNGRLGAEDFFRHSLPLPFNGVHGRERHERMRSSYGRLQPSPAVESAHGRWMPEVVFSMEQSNFHDSRSLFDQHRDMRLDIDNMSYEELLALEERIGKVNTGLTDDMILKCMTKIICCSRDQVREREDGNCVICLESYKDGEELGILRCSHGYHVSCIRQWLQIKNVCPICKSSAVDK